MNFRIIARISAKMPFAHHEYSISTQTIEFYNHNLHHVSPMLWRTDQSHNAPLRRDHAENFKAQHHRHDNTCYSIADWAGIGIEGAWDADWLQKDLDNPKVRVFEVSVDTGVYERGYIQGALKINWHTDLVDKDTTTILYGWIFLVFSSLGTAAGLFSLRRGWLCAAYDQGTTATKNHDHWCVFTFAGRSSANIGHQHATELRPVLNHRSQSRNGSEIQ